MVNKKLETTLSLITLMTLSSSELEDQDLELPSDFLKLDSRLLAFPNYSQQDLTLLQHREVLTQLLETCIMMTGDGTSMTLSRDLTG